MKNSSVPGNLDRAQNAGRLEAFWVRCGQWKSGIFPLVTEQYVDEVVLHGLGKEYLWSRFPSGNVFVKPCF